MNKFTNISFYMLLVTAIISGIVLIRDVIIEVPYDTIERHIVCIAIAVMINSIVCAIALKRDK